MQLLGDELTGRRHASRAAVFASAIGAEQFNTSQLDGGSGATGRSWMGGTGWSELEG